MDDIKKQIVERVQSANNILVTVSNSPTVDQLAAAIGLTLMLNKLGKHGTAVFSGVVPHAMEFLQPEKTIEKNTDSLQDFIIALDKSKADKLRYKVEDSHVKIFITPYRSSLTEADLEFSQGDFNVEVVIALGVTDQKDLDAAITAHGRILHDATVISVNTHTGGQLGTINLVEDKASSLCEVAVDLAEQLKPGGLDEQIATAFLTGIVAETNRFSNEKTSASTMDVSSKLMVAGANQQLVATKLEEPEPVSESVPEPVPTPEPTPEPVPEPPEVVEAPQPPPGPGTEEEVPDIEEGVKTEEPEEPTAETPGEEKPSTDGTLEIDHGEKHPEEPEEVPKHQINIDDQGILHRLEDEKAAEKNSAPGDSGMPKFVSEPPISGGTLTANSRPEALDPPTDPLSLPPVGGPLLNHENNYTGGSGSVSTTTPPSDPLFSTAPKPDDTLSDIEKSLGSPHIKNSEPAGDNSSQDDVGGTPQLDVDNAREAIDQAMQAAPTDQPLPPIAALHAQPTNLDFGHNPAEANATSDPGAPAVTPSPATSTTGDNNDITGSPDPSVAVSTAPVVQDPGAPPPVPPPMVPPPAPADSQSDSSTPL